MNPRLTAPLALAASAAALATMLSGCSSKTETSSPSSASVTQMATTPASPDGGCPSLAPDKTGAAEWTLTGTTGSVAVTGSTDTTAPRVDITPPFEVAATQVHTLTAGSGPVVAPTATVSVCYMGVDGRDGHVFDSSYNRGEPAEFPLDGVVPGFQKAIAGQTVGSTVAVAMTAADGYPQGQARAGIAPGDTLVFAIRILSAS